MARVTGKSARIGYRHFQKLPLEHDGGQSQEDADEDDELERQRGGEPA